MPQDNSLAETLGGLGQSLTNMWNPKTRMEAFMLQQRLAMEQEQMRILQQKQAAREAAARHFSFLSPSDQAVIEGMIYNDAPMDQVLATGARLANKNKNLDGAPADVRIRAWNEMYPGQPWKEAGAPIFGPKDQAEEAARVVTAKGAETTATETAKFKAQDEHMRSIYGAAGYPAPGDTSPEALAKRMEAFRYVYPNTQPPDIIPTGHPAVTALIASNAATAEALKTKKQKEAELEVSGRPAGAGVIGGAGGAGETPGKAEYMPMDPEKPYGVPRPMLRYGSSGTPIRGLLPNEAETWDKEDTRRAEELRTIHSQGQAGIQMQGTITRLRELDNKLAQLGYDTPEKRAILRKEMEVSGMVPNEAAQALKAKDLLINQEIPALRQQLGNIRMAGPEFIAIYKMIGDGTLPPEVGNDIYAGQQALAELADQRRTLAARALGWDKTQPPLSYTEYQQIDQKLTSQINARTQELLNQWHAISASHPQEAAKALAEAQAAETDAVTRATTAAGLPASKAPTPAAPVEPAKPPVAPPPVTPPPALKPAEPVVAKPPETAEPPVVKPAETPPPAPVPVPTSEAGFSQLGGFFSSLFGGGGGSAPEPQAAPAAAPAPAAPAVAPPQYGWHVSSDGTVTKVPMPAPPIIPERGSSDAR
jgi:hypothetical protein